MRQSIEDIFVYVPDVVPVKVQVDQAAQPPECPGPESRELVVIEQEWSEGCDVTEHPWREARDAVEADVSGIAIMFWITGIAIALLLIGIQSFNILSHFVDGC